MLRIATLSRWKAASIHLGLSCLIASAVAVLMFFLWFPSNLVRTTGGLDLFGLLISVDITLGPLLTLVVFNPMKKSLKFDLAVIALFQIGALLYGLHAVSLARPAYVVFAVDRFEVVTAADVLPEEQAKAIDARYRQTPWLGPQFVGAKLPKDRAERERILFSSLSGGADLQSFPQYYEPYAAMAAQAAKKGRPVLDLMAHRPNQAGLIEQFLKEHNVQPSDVVFLPLSAKKRDMSAILRTGTGDILGFLPVDPW